MEDIAPALLELLQKRFREKIAADPRIRAMYKKITDGQATYADAEEYAYFVGDVLAKVFGENLSSAVLPDGKMYYNIAEKVLKPMLEENHMVVSGATEVVQKILNQKAGLGLKAQTVAANADRIQGLMDKVSNAEIYDDVAWVLDEPVRNFSMSVVDDTLRENVEFHGNAGLSPVIVRRTRGKSCKWCANLAGVYTYPVISREVYQRHENCRCTVEYDPKDGRRKRQNVHTKEWS